MNRNGANEKNAAKRRASRRSIRFMVLMSINLPLLALMGLFLTYDYNRVIAERVEEKHIALEEEAKSLLPAITQLSRGEVSDVQRYVDTVCAEMQSEQSPGHHIAVRLPTVTLQATSHNRASPEMLAALQLAAESPNHQAAIGDQELVVGTAKQDGITTYVAETLTNVRRAIRSAAVRRLGGLLVAFVVLGIIVNVTLIRAVTTPVEQLVATVQQIGKGQFDGQFESFQSAELDYLATEIDAMRESLASADRRRKTQLAKARAIQHNLLPKARSTPGLHVAHLFEPAEDIGGDYYDILALEDGALLFCVADVTGHGIPAAMNAAMLKTMLLEAIDSQVSPARVLSAVNQRLVAVSLPEDFVSMVLVRMEPHRGRVMYASAGHEPSWLVSADGRLHELPSTGLLLGIDESATWEDATFEMKEGDRIFALSDGVSETFNAQGETFGRTRLCRMLSGCRTYAPKQAIQLINDTLTEFRGETPQYDDVTVVLAEATQGANGRRDDGAS